MTVDDVAVNAVVVAIVFDFANVAIIINLKNVGAVYQHIDCCLFLLHCYCLGRVKHAMSD